MVRAACRGALVGRTRTVEGDGVPEGTTHRIRLAHRGADGSIDAALVVAHAEEATLAAWKQKLELEGKEGKSGDEIATQERQDYGKVTFTGQFQDLQEKMDWYWAQKHIPKDEKKTEGDQNDVDMTK